jgi:predicted RNase H-like HicB family nuclease
MDMKLIVVIEKDKNGYFAYCPSLKGCQTQGDTYEETVENIKEAISLYLEDLRADKEELKKLNISSQMSLTTVDVKI